MKILRTSLKEKFQESSFDAMIWSKELHGKKATIFDYIKIGQKFSFPNTDEIFIKVSSTAYTPIDKKIKFKTSKQASVIPISESLVREAFRADQATKLIDKLMNVMRRRIRKPILHTTIEKDYINKEGKFKGFLAYIPSMKLFFRINFKLTQSDEIVSLDFYEDIAQFKKGYPSFTVDTTGLNIIQIIDVFEDNIEMIRSGENIEFDDVALGESVITERTNMDRQEQLFNMWVEEDKEALKKLSTMRMPDIYAEFLSLDPHHSEITNVQSFTKLAKQTLFKKGLTNITFRKRTKGKKEREIVDQAKADEFEDMIAEMSWEDKFEILHNSIEAVVNGDIQALLISGSPGSGKSEETYSKLAELGVDYRLFQGGLKNGDELFKILAKYRDNEIILFDDFDSVFKNTDMVNILKAALQNKKERIITWRDKKLLFTSGVIFISNMQKFDSAIVSRALNVVIDLTNEQMIDKIEKTMENFHPEIDMEKKKQAIAFLREIQGGVKAVDYRGFQKVLIAQQLNPTKWKKFAIFLIKNEG